MNDRTILLMFFFGGGLSFAYQVFSAICKHTLTSKSYIILPSTFDKKVVSASKMIELEWSKILILKMLASKTELILRNQIFKTISWWDRVTFISKAVHESFTPT